MLFKNILVPWDGSKYSNHAFKIALNIAKTYDSKISVIHCIEVDEYGGTWYPDSRYSKAIRKKQTEIAKNEILKLVDQAKKISVPIYSNILTVDSTTKQLVAFAKSKKIDLVVMGSHGKTGWKRMLLGSVASSVSQNVHCPVLIVK
jgi:nucleotide-binding universal stress UspA family protein